MSGNNISLNNDNIYIPVIFTVLLIASSFVPLLQVVLLEAFRLYTPLSSTLGVEVISFFYVTNSALSIFILHQFYKSESTWTKIATNILAVIFLYPVLIYLFNNFESESLWTFILSAFGFGAILSGVGIYKIQKSKSEDV